MAKYAEASPKVLQYLEEGATNKEAAERAGIDEPTFYRWMKEKSEFCESVHNAREIGRKRAVQDVEASLLRLAKGYEYEDVRTEYASELNPHTGKLEPVIKKQTRFKRIVQANSEAIKFFLSNRAPEEWKNKQEHDIANLDVLKSLHVERVNGDGDGHISSSEAEVDQ